MECLEVTLATNMRGIAKVPGSNLTRTCFLKTGNFPPFHKIVGLLFVCYYFVGLIVTSTFFCCMRFSFGWSQLIFMFSFTTTICNSTNLNFVILCIFFLIFFSNRLVFYWLSNLFLDRLREHSLHVFLRIAQNVTNLRRFQSFLLPPFFHSKIACEFSLNAIECASGRVYRKLNIIPVNFLKFLVTVFFRQPFRFLWT